MTSSFKYAYWILLVGLLFASVVLIPVGNLATSPITEVHFVGTTATLEFLSNSTSPPFLPFLNYSGRNETIPAQTNETVPAQITPPSPPPGAGYFYALVYTTDPVSDLEHAEVNFYQTRPPLLGQNRVVPGTGYVIFFVAVGVKSNFLAIGVEQDASSTTIALEYAINGVKTYVNLGPVSNYLRGLNGVSLVLSRSDPDGDDWHYAINGVIVYWAKVYTGPEPIVQAGGKSTYRYNTLYADFFYWQGWFNGQQNVPFFSVPTKIFSDWPYYLTTFPPWEFQTSGGLILSYPPRSGGIPVRVM